VSGERGYSQYGTAAAAAVKQVMVL